MEPSPVDSGPQQELRRGQMVKIVNPGPYATQAAFRNRVGLVVYQLFPLRQKKKRFHETALKPTLPKTWIVAVERMDREKVMSSRQAAAAENLFEFIPLKAGDVEILSSSGDGEEEPATKEFPPAPDWIVRRFRRPPLPPVIASSVKGRLGVGHEKAKRVAIVVPFRDAHAAQNRMKQLKEFVPYFVKYLSKFALDFRIIIVEQTNDRRKFNRGQLLNIGFLLGKNDYDCDSFIFHDVDLLPDEALGPWYSIKPCHPVHLARVWGRYADNEDYFGGVAAWSADDFERINGFPNNYWGWGGEDDEMMRRCKTVFGDNFQMDAPLEGQLQDLEDMSLEEKLDFLRANPQWKCNVRWELRDAHVDTWAFNGIRTGNDFKEFKAFDVIETQTAICDTNSDKAIKVTVQCALSGDWTDTYATEKQPESSS